MDTAEDLKAELMAHPQRLRFKSFFLANPEALQRLVQLALQKKALGYRRYSIKGLWELLRHDVEVRTGHRQVWKLPNEFTALAARLLMATNPTLQGFFITRRVASKLDSLDLSV